MYAPDTILKLREQKPDIVLEGKGEDGEDIEVPFPYNRVRVINQSPINHGQVGSEWVGQDGQGVIITPLEGHGSTIDQPVGRIRELYEVEEIPSQEIVPVRIKVVDQASAGDSPEEIFAAVARERGEKRTEGRGRTPHDPLTEAGL
jgi:hypothetical protein